MTYSAGLAAKLCDGQKFPTDMRPAPWCSDWSALARDVCDALVVRAIASPGPNASILLPKLWAASHEALLRGLVALYDKDALNMSRILDVCQVTLLLSAACVYP